MLRSGSRRAANYNNDNSKRKLLFDLVLICLLWWLLSSQYFTLYVIIVSLLFNSEPGKMIHKRKSKRWSFYWFRRFKIALTSRSTKMQQHHKLLKVLSNNYSFRQGEIKQQRGSQQLPQEWILNVVKLLVFVVVAYIIDRWFCFWYFK